MTTEPRWLNKRALLLLHGESLAAFGGASGLRDDGLLDSALARPVNRHADQPETTFAELAAGYALGLARSHPFVDGNKRTAFLAIGLFLALNGRRLTAGQVDAIQTVSALAAGEIDEPALAAWIQRKSAER